MGMCPPQCLGIAGWQARSHVLAADEGWVADDIIG